MIGRWAAILMIVPAFAGRLCAAGPAPAGSSALTGDDQILWVVTGGWDADQRHLLSRIAWIDPAAMTVKPLRLPAQLGEMRCSATWNGKLHLFMSIEGSGTTTTAHYSYQTPAQSRRELRLPGDALPIALAGGSKELPGLWALVDAKTAGQIATEWAKYQRGAQSRPAGHSKSATATRPADHKPPASEPAIYLPDGAYLVVYEGGRWRPGCICPQGLAEANRVWMTISAKRLHLFWQATAISETVSYAAREDDAWLEMPPVRFDRPVAGGFAGILNKQLTFAGLVVDESGSALRCEPRVFIHAKREWNQLPTLKDGDGKPLSLAKGSVVGGLGDKLAMLCDGKEGAEVGLWSPTDGRPVLAFTTVPIRTDDELPSSGDRLRETAYLLLLIGIVTLVYWRRRESVGLQVVLPPGMALADFGRRGLAALIDVAPAGIVVGLIWRAPLAEYMAAWQTVVEAQETTPPPGQGLVWAWVCFALIYSGWCMAFELYMAATPGKRLLGCQVVSEWGRPASPSQIVIRNASRLVELLPHLMVWPFLLLVLITRHRQRVGDMIARTLVVEIKPAPEDTDQPKPPTYQG